MLRRIANAIRIINAPCRDMTKLISRSSDGKLPALERFALRVHYLYCAACRRYRGQLSRMRTLIHTLADPEQPEAPKALPALPESARERIARRIRTNLS